MQSDRFGAALTRQIQSGGRGASFRYNPLRNTCEAT
jgi:hypothetical protein